MEKKHIIGLVLTIVIATAGGLTYYFGFYLPSLQKTPGNDIGEVTGLPESTPPNASLLLKDIDDSTIANVSLAEIVERLNNGSLNLVKCTIEKDGKTLNLAGFNPLELMDIYGLYYADEFESIAKDQAKSTLNYSGFYLGDPAYYKDAVGEYSMIAISINATWLRQYDSTYGDFRIYGQVWSTSQKIKDVETLKIKTELVVKVKVNGILNISLSKSNLSTIIGLNYTSYEWGYFDNSSNKSWGPKVHNGTTIASIAQYINISSSQYNVSFISVDGWGLKWKYNKTQMEDGITGVKINTPQEDLNNEGKQTILNNLDNTQQLGHNDGPFRVILPGHTRDRYQKAVVEIQFSV